MTYPAEVIQRALGLISAGSSQAAVSRELGVSRAAVAEWLRSDAAELLAARSPCGGGPECVARRDLDTRAYVYLLGLYLGDGCISVGARGTSRLRVMCCDQYPALIRSCEAAIEAVKPHGRVGRTQCQGCTEVRSDYVHWPCLFPQHGPGRKHERPIELEPWQRDLVDLHPFELLAGLLHSDGCRVMNRIHTSYGDYAYPRYFFSNVSPDIRGIFCAACDLVGVEWRQNRWNSISVARRASVAILDANIAPKT